MRATEDNVHRLFPTVEARAMQAMADYKVGVADETTGKVRAIRAVIEYGKALLEGRKDRSNIAFKTWVTDSKLDVGEPWSNVYERSHAMKIATVLGSAPNTTLDACPHTRPSHIMKWYRKKHPDPKRKKHSKQKTPAPKPHYKEAEITALFDQGMTQEEIAEKTKVGLRQIRHVTERVRIEREATAKASVKLTEDQALAEAEARFSEKSKLTLTDAIRIHKARLDKAFEQTVSNEVRRRIDAANDAVRIRLKECEQELLQFQRDRGKRGVFTKQQFNRMKMLCHPDDPLSPALRAELLQVLLKNEASLVKLEK